MTVLNVVPSGEFRLVGTTVLYGTMNAFRFHLALTIGGSGPRSDTTILGPPGV